MRTRDSTFSISLIPGDISSRLEASIPSGLSLEKISGIISADIPPAKIQGVLKVLLISNSIGTLFPVPPSDLSSQASKRIASTFSRIDLYFLNH